MRTPFFFAAALLLLQIVPVRAMPEIPRAVYPLLEESAPSPDHFIPEGWHMEARATGDLNGDDTEDDVVFVLRQNDPRNVLTKQSMGMKEFDTNPRILGVALRKGQVYRLIAQDYTIIPRHVVPTMEDPFDSASGLSIAPNGTFSVALESFFSAGSWETRSAKLTFRYQNGRVELIGWDRTSLMRNSGEMTQTSANLSTGEVHVTTGHVEREETKHTRRKTALRPIAIDDVGDGLAFDAETRRDKK